MSLLGTLLPSEREAARRSTLPLLGCVRVWTVLRIIVRTSEENALL